MNLNKISATSYYAFHIAFLGNQGFNPPFARRRDYIHTEEAGNGAKRLMMEDSDLYESDFSDLVITVAHFRSCRFAGSDFSHVEAIGTSFVDCDFADCNLYTGVFTSANFSLAQLTRVRAFNVEFSRTDFSDASFVEARLNECTFEGTRFAKASGERCQMKRSSFKQADMRRIEM